ncbi:TolC family protein [Sphingobacterium sp. SGG-5]|uniref:TolC family protein n=1 Tax=Sphingobacterium sp. SGG-5 TaxID=2710881 RepID=UPI0013EABC1D|nr:TolC family protein [Sphingobacterium sp. SGG-5]NGM62303.1 TolC family protein [Sphingobacterium sp. SGG-5]
MKINNWSMTTLLLLFGMSTHAQEKKQLSLDDVMQLAFYHSAQAQALDSKVKTSQLEYEASKGSQLPDAKLTGTYMLMNSPNVNIQLPIGEGDSMDLATNQLLLGQLSINMPLYTGGKIKNNIQAAEHTWKATALQSTATKQQFAIQAMHNYIALYKAQKTMDLIAENIKKSAQQVNDFKAMEANGIIARNDLLKAEWQLSNYKVSYQEALKNVNILSYQLSIILGLDENTTFDHIHLSELQNQNIGRINLEDRYEVQSLQAQKQVADDQIKVAKSAYFPTVFATAGYAALQLQHVVTVTNAANVGVGLSYDIGALYKNKKKVHVAQQHIEELNLSLRQVEDDIKTQIHKSREEVQLAQEKQKLYQEALIQAKENYRIVKDKYDNGVADTDDLLEADVQQLQSEINLAIGDASIVEKQYDLLLATGQLNLK